MKTLTLLALTVASSLLLTGCPPPCNTLYAPAYLELALPLADGEMVSEDWSVQIADVGGSPCTLARADLAPDTPVSVCDDMIVAVMSTLSGETTLRLERYTPEEVTVVFAMDGMEVVSHTARPEYTYDEPNGVACGERAMSTLRIE